MADGNGYDPAEYKQGQRSDWRQAAAGWRRWADTIEAGGQAMTGRLLELAGIGPGERVLDVATGYGEPAISAAARVGPKGSVVGTDISAEMIEVAEERAASAGVNNVAFEVTDAEELELPGGRFDAALSRCGLMFLPDPTEALRRIRESLGPGGRIAASTWGPPERVGFLSLPMGALATVIEPPPPPPPGTPGVSALGDPEQLERHLDEAGFSDVETGTMTVTYGFARPEDVMRWMRDVAPPLWAIVDPHPEEVQERCWQAITDAAAEQAEPDGGVKLACEAVLARAVRV